MTSITYGGLKLSRRRFNQFGFNQFGFNAGGSYVLSDRGRSPHLGGVRQIGQLEGDDLDAAHFDLALQQLAQRAAQLLYLGVAVQVAFGSKS